MLDLERLNHFVQLAHNLHFGRTAKQLGMDQSMLTRSIQRLEESIGAKLLERSRRHVALTPAGSYLLEEAEKVLHAVDQAARVARHTASGRMGDLQLALDRSTTYGFAAKAIRLFREAAPDIAVRLSTLPSHGNLERLRAGELDVMTLLRTRNDRRGLSGLSVVHLRSYPYVVVAPSNWPIARKTELRLADLADQPMVLFPRERTPEFYGAVVVACQQAGFVPNVVQESWQLPLTLGLVAAEVGVSLVAGLDYLPAMHGIKLLPVVDLPDMMHADALVVWDPRRESWPVAALVKAFQDAAQEDAPAA